MSDNAIPQWKKELIARLQNRRSAHAQQQQLFSERTLASSPVQQPVSVGRSERCECVNMVQQEQSESDEDLHYGPGIVSKLKERYLSLAQREKPIRPTVLRKAASLENILDDAAPKQRLFQARENKAPNRYAKKGSELKRARSVETISSADEREGKELKRESMHEELLIGSNGNLIILEKNYEHSDNYARINRPKRIAPLMNEKEKPPTDVVKQKKMIFERRAKPQHPTGEVAAKVATYKNIIVQNKPKKPVIKVKPALGDKPKTNGIRVKTKDREFKPVDQIDNNFTPEIVRPKSPDKPVDVIRSKTPEEIKNSDLLKSPVYESKDVPPEVKSPVELSSPKLLELKLSSDVPSPKIHEKSTSSLPSPIPDISRVDFKAEENGVKATSLTETPDLIITSSPLPVVISPSFRISATEHFIKEEIRLSNNERSPTKPSVNFIEDIKKISPPSPTSSSSTAPATANSMTFNFAKTVDKTQNQLPIVNKNVSNTQTPPSQPLKLEINGVNETKKKPSSSSNETTTQQQILVSTKPPLTTLEIEKNLINTAKTLEQPKNNISVITKCASEVTVNKVPKVRKPPRELENNSIVFKFTDRKDVPDYVHNDGVNRVTKLEKPKVGEGGIILLPGASIGESFTDEDEEILRSLEGPPSPCDVVFINDNILIDGKSSLSQKTKKPKMKISFVDEGPEVYEYPSESSLLIEDSPKSPPLAQLRPSLTGTSLGNYTPKSTEEFQPGVTRSVQNAPISKPEVPDTNELILQEVEKPILFSAGANTDILF